MGARIIGRGLGRMVLGGLLLSSLAMNDAWGQPTEPPVPRILLVGDSYDAFLWGFRSFKTVLPEYPGLERYLEAGSRTAIMGVKACDYRGGDFIADIAAELDRYPTIDIVNMTLGPNDFLSGTVNVLPEDLGREVAWEDFLDNPAWNEQWLFDAIAGHVAVLVDAILAMRPDIRITLCSTDYGNLPADMMAEMGIDLLRFQTAWVNMYSAIRGVITTRDRVFFVHNFGLLQHLYGVPEADPPVAPGVLPMPGGYPDYTPYPGGDPALNCPLDLLIDDFGHLTGQGCEEIARRCVNEFFQTWLSWPKVLEIRMTEAAAPAYTYQVTFSEPVTGVDATDFTISTQESGPAFGAAVESVTGDGTVFNVSILMNDEPGTPLLQVRDDDTIRDADLNPLGGAGLGNGNFAANGVFPFEDLLSPAPGDFDAAMCALQESYYPYHRYAEGSVTGLSFVPGECDMNGGVDFGEDPVVIKGNGFLEAYEFALITACHNDENLDFTARGGVSHAMVAEAWENNYQHMLACLGGPEGLPTKFLPGTDTILAGYITLGDPISSILPVMLVTLLKDQLGEFITGLTAPNLKDYILLKDSISYLGDADGDGFTNGAEYNHFVTSDDYETAKMQYVHAALNPNLYPGSEGEEEGTEEGQPEGVVEGQSEGEGILEGQLEGVNEGEGEGLAEGEGEDEVFTADQNGDHQISLSELLRVIQFFNSGGMHCADGTEDGYAPGPGDTACPPHACDYNPQDWLIGLSELLRLIQFFNSGGYHYCPDENTEDGFCPGL